MLPGKNSGVITPKLGVNHRLMESLRRYGDGKGDLVSGIFVGVYEGR